MIFVVLYKHIICAVDKTIDTGHITDCNTNYKIILLMILFITSWCKPLKTPIQRDMHLCHLSKALFCQIQTLINLYVSATAQLEYVKYLLGCRQEIKKTFLISYLAAPRPTLALNGMINKKNYIFKMILLYSNLATNARVNFKFCSLLIIMHQKLHTYTNMFNHAFSSYQQHIMLKQKIEHMICLCLINSI